MFLTNRGVLTAALLACLAGCANREVGYEVERADFGSEVIMNRQMQIAALGGDRLLLSFSDDFRRSAPDTITFAFDSAVIDPAARQTLDLQAAWILRHPAIRLRIYGNTDLVGSASYNYQLGLRRAQVVAAYFVSRGVGAGRLEAVVSFGETRPIIVTNDPERLNRRTVTEVVGYAVPAAGFDFDGKRAQIVYENYVTGDEPQPVQNVGATEVFMPN